VARREEGGTARAERPMSGGVGYSVLQQADELRDRRKHGDEPMPDGRDVTLALGGNGVPIDAAARERALRVSLVTIRRYAEAALTGVPRLVLLEMVDHALAGDLL
jgi:hypothetical protein